MALGSIERLSLTRLKLRKAILENGTENGIVNLHAQSYECRGGVKWTVENFGVEEEREK